MPRNHGQMSRRTLIGGAAAAAVTTVAGPAVAAPAAANARQAPGAPRDASEALLDQWAQAPGAHPLLPDVSRAGYRLGSRLPRLPVKARVTDFGARADGVTDCAPAFNAALRAVGERGGGAVQVPRGTYLLASPVFMQWSNVALRGAGRDATVLHFTRTLDDGYMPSRQPNGNSRWSWTGGQIWFIAPERKALSESEGYAGTEHWLLGDSLTGVGPASRGQQTLLVSSTAGLGAGDVVVLECDNPADASLLTHLAGEIPGARQYDWLRRAPQLVTGSPSQFPSYATLRWPVRIEAVFGDRLVRLAQPLKCDLRPAWPARLRAIGPTVHDSGVEQLTVRNALIPITPHNQHPGSNGVCFQAVHDCWARDVRVENFDLAFGFTSAKANTLRRVAVGGRCGHHSFACRAQSHDNLVDDFEIEKFTVPVPAGSVHHGINLEGVSSGNVWRRGRMDEGTFDTHRALPFENVRTNITLVNNGRVGGSAAAGPLFGARIVHWNVQITSGSPYALTIADVAPRSATVGIQGANGTDSELTPDFAGDLENLLADHGVRPRVTDLYAAQRDRLGLD